MGGALIMISWRIWQTLMTPFVAHPLFQRWGVWEPPVPLAQRKGRWAAVLRFISKHEGLLVGLTLLLLIGAMVFWGFWSVFFVIIIVPLIFLVVIVPLLLALAGTLYGLASGIAVSDAIINERRQGRYTLMGLTPYGFEGTNLALCSLAINRSETLRAARWYIRLLYTLLLALFVVPMVNMLIIYLIQPQPWLLDSLLDLSLGWALSALLFVDYTQSTNIANLLGIISPMVNRTRYDVRQFLLGIFLALQIGTYILLAILAGFALPALLTALGVTIDLWWYGWPVIVVLFLLREVQTVILWRVLAEQSNTDLDDLDRLARVGIRQEPLPVSLLRSVWPFMRRGPASMKMPAVLPLVDREA